MKARGLRLVCAALRVPCPLVGGEGRGQGQDEGTERERGETEEGGQGEGRGEREGECEGERGDEGEGRGKKEGMDDIDMIEDSGGKEPLPPRVRQVRWTHITGEGQERGGKEGRGRERGEGRDGVTEGENVYVLRCNSPSLSLPPSLPPSLCARVCACMWNAGGGRRRARAKEAD